MRTRTASKAIFFAASALILLSASKIETAVDHDHVFRLTGNGKIDLTDVHTGERLAIIYRDGRGVYDESSLDAIDRTMRCHGDHETHPISLKLVELIDHLQDHFSSEEVMVVSGYRSPEYNAALKRRLRRVAHDSLHTQGMAMDIRLPAVDKRKLGAYARLLGAGGVGVYRSSQFVHVDSGPVRSW